MVPHNFGTRITVGQCFIDRNFGGYFCETVKLIKLFNKFNDLHGESSLDSSAIGIIIKTY